MAGTAQNQDQPDDRQQRLQPELGIKTETHR